jgi:hypothetical protein
MDSLYKILNIDHDVIIDRKLDLYDKNLYYLNDSVLIINKFHGYFHFEQSFLYLICAYINWLMSNDKEKTLYLEKAIFQDHNNQQALDFDNVNKDVKKIFSYNKNYKYERDFLSFALGEFKYIPQLILLDNFLSSGDEDGDCNYQSHRLYFAKSMKYLFKKELDSSLAEIDKAIKMVENSHQSYHFLASDIYAKRSNIFKLMGRLELADNDLVKSHDFVNI